MTSPETPLLALLAFSTLFALLGAGLGGSVASFACVVAERVPAGRTLGGRSHCACGRQLRAGENIPIIGWLRVRGVATCCGSRLPTRLVLTEAAVALVGALSFGLVAPTALVLGVSPLWPLGAAVAAVAVGGAGVVAWCWDRSDA